MDWVSLIAGAIGGIATAIGGTMIANKLRSRKAPAKREVYEAIADKKKRELQRKEADYAKPQPIVATDEEESPL